MAAARSKLGTRWQGARRAYRTCRSLGRGRLQACYRAARYLCTGKTGRYGVDWAQAGTLEGSQHQGAARACPGGGVRLGHNGANEAGPAA